MKKDNSITTVLNTGEEKGLTRKFWKQAFLVYALIEIIILSLQYFITWRQCTVCVLPPAFYVVNWLQHISFTALLWYFINRLYHVHRWKLILLNIVLFIIYYFIWIGSLYAILNSGYDWLVWKTIPPRAFTSIIYNSWADIGKFVLKLSAFYVLKFYIEYKMAERQRIQLALINKDMQLNLLKQQLSPHFYFNTLNNLYGLARSNSAKLSEAIHQLFNIMQYVIVDCNKSKVFLSDEINFLQSYIALEKLRYEKNTVIEMKVQGETGSKTIVPLLLIQFVENAFKHGMKEKSDRNWVKVSMFISGNEMCYTVDNSFYETVSSRGIGINSVKHILNLQYEDRHSISMAHQANCFSITLKLDLV